jgi:hypothetical protein
MPSREQLSRVCHNRCFFVCEQGILGVGPKHMQPGDIIVIIAGTRMPLVLRRLQDPPETFLLVENAYVPKMMHGEVLGRLHLDRQGRYLWPERFT